MKQFLKMNAHFETLQIKGNIFFGSNKLNFSEHLCSTLVMNFTFEPWWSTLVVNHQNCKELMNMLCILKLSKLNETDFENESTF